MFDFKRHLNKNLSSKADRNLKTARVFITGDKHRKFWSLYRFCKKNHTSYSDTVIILGDSGINYYGDKRDTKLKKKLSRIPVTLFCIHGNKERRANDIDDYKTKTYLGGIVFYEEEFPNILFAKDAEIYDFCGYSTLVIGGAHSVDKRLCLERSRPYWFNEEPGHVIKQKVERKLKQNNYQIDVILSHTVPLKYEPKEMLVSSSDTPETNEVKKTWLDIDKSTEVWLDYIEEITLYYRWYAGHYHTNKCVDRLTILYDNFEELV